jgi:subtilisin family serine protease
MNKWLRVTGTLAVLTLLSANLAVAAPKASDDYVTRMVSFKSGKHAAKELAKAKYEVVYDWTENANAALVKVKRADADKLKGLEGVAAVEEEGVFHTMGLFNDALPITWGLDAVNAPEAWAAGATGQGIKVCILDTGIDYNHPEFFKNGVSIIKGSKNFVSDGHATAADGNGHGTHVAGTIAAQGALVKGVAPDVDLYIGRVLGDDGSGATSGIINGVNWCTDTVKANIISMSLGGSFKSNTEQNLYTSVYNKGVLVIAAAGNDGNNRVSYPAGYTNVVSVAAVDNNLAKADFSQYNSDVEIAGPGVSVLSSVPIGTGTQTTAKEGTTAYTSVGLEFAGLGTVTGPLVECGTAQSTTSCTGKPASGAWIAVVSRGTNTFAEKHDNVKAQGASAMLLTNNDTALPDDAGSFTLGAAGNWLPSVSVSYNSGVAIRSGGLGTGTVSLTAWDYAFFNGTSMATPHASAVAALAWSAKPTLTNVKIRSILQTTAQDLGAAGRDTNFGYGLVKADAAVAKAKVTN